MTLTRWYKNGNQWVAEGRVAGQVVRSKAVSLKIAVAGCKAGMKVIVDQRKEGIRRVQ